MNQFKLTNGLTVQLIDKPGFKKQFAAVMIDFGGIDQQYRDHDSIQPLPAGVAHFIEHQLFNKESGDISQKFASQGAETNAFTSPSKTAYFFSGTANLITNLDLLAELVSQPYFQEESVTLERQIIAQELSLYQDQPDFQLESGLLQQLYGPKHPMAIDIAGTPASLQQITAEVLLTAYQAYYQPQNMKLCVVADLAQQDLKQYFTDSKNSWLSLNAHQDGQAEYVRLTPQPALAATKEVQLPSLNNNKWSYGIVAPTLAAKSERILLQLDLDLVLSTVFAETSPIYQQWRDQGLVDDSFQFQTTLERQFNHVTFTANTEFPAELQKQVEMVLQTITATKLTNFAAVQQQMVGHHLFSEDDLAGICLENLELSYYDVSWSTFGEAIRERTLTQSLVNVQAFIQSSQSRAYWLLGGNHHD